MGGGESKAVLQPEESRINHERFAVREMLRSEDGEETIAISVAVPSEKEYQAWVKTLAKAAANDALFLPLSHSFTKSGFCGSAGVLVFESYPFILSDEIHNRECLSARYFEESELWYLVLTLLTGVQHWHAQGAKAGDVRPLNVFISEDGAAKLACLASWPLERTNFEKTLDRETTYLAPEEVLDLAYARTDPSGSYQLAETFSVGLTLLDAATLGDSTALYRNPKQIDYEGLEARVGELGSRPYGNALVQLITAMVQPNPEERSSVGELLEWLTPFEAAINNFSAFYPETFPAKFSKSSILPNQSELNSNYHPQPYVSGYAPPLPYYTSSTAPDPPFPPSSAPVPLTSAAALGGVAVSESTYVPFSSKFSLEKIDEQLEQSRRNFPS